MIQDCEGEDHVLVLNTVFQLGQGVGCPQLAGKALLVCLKHGPHHACHGTHQCQKQLLFWVND